MRIILFSYFFVLAFNLFSQKINWQSFNKTALETAKTQNKFILLNIGASWCHWCHVMNETTYQNPKIVKTLTSHFITCYENQDLRSDLQSQYKEYGWPAIIIFDKNGNELLKLSGYQSTDDFNNTLNEIITGKQLFSAKKNNQTKLNSWNDSIKKYIENDFYNFLDMEKGGFLMYQKYLDYDAIEYALLNYKQNKELENWLHLTISKSYLINDSVWGGAYQYSTGRNWYYPHFEKLLSMQARYLKLYAKYYGVFKKTETLKWINKILDYTNLFLKSKNVLYYNSQDADLIEGKHSATYFGLTSDARFKLGIPKIDTNCYVKENAMFAEALATLGVITKKNQYIKEAETILESIKASFYSTTYGYKHSKIGDDMSVTLSDNLAVAKCLLLIYNITHNPSYKGNLMELADIMIKQFKAEDMGFYTYNNPNNPLKPNKVLSENIEMARVLNKTYYLSHNKCHDSASSSAVSFALSTEILQNLLAEPGIITLMSEKTNEPLKFVLISDNINNDLESALSELCQLPNDYFIILKPNEEEIASEDLYRNMKQASSGQNCIFACNSSQCSAPIFNKEELLLFLQKQSQ